MSTAAVVIKEERENYSGRKMMSDFREYCINKGQEFTEDVLRSWDEQYNNHKIRDSFGSKDRVYEAGMRHMYRQYLDRYNYILVKLASGKSVRLSAIRTDSSGRRSHLSAMTRPDLEYNIERIKAEIKTQYDRVKIFGMDVRAFRTAVNEAIDEIE